MIVRLIQIMALLITFNTLHAKESRDLYLNYLAEKTITDFKTAVEAYNAKKSGPTIYLNKDFTYGFKANKSEVHFSIVNYLKGEIYIDGRLTKRSELKKKEKKTTFLDLMIAKSYAQEGDISAESMKAIAVALGELDGTLENAGALCFFGDCLKEAHQKNLAKILNGLSKQKEDCQEQEEEQNISIRKYKTGYAFLDSLHSIHDTNFNSLKAFFDALSRVNADKVDGFSEDKLGIEPGAYATCIQVMGGGTLVDDGDKGFFKQINDIKGSGGINGYTSGEVHSAKDAARVVCIQFEELKNCIANLEKNLDTINELKRKAKPGNQDIIQQLPSTEILSR